MRKNRCPYCGKPIFLADDYYMYGIDIPYRNIFFHKECFKKIQNKEELHKILQDTTDLWYNIKDDSKRKRRKNVK